jgi:hypothetical protein
MSRTFAGWVEPIAARYEAARQEVVALARRVPLDAWADASSVEGWTFRDVLAHLAEGDAYKRQLLRAVLDGESTDMRPVNELREERNTAIRRRGAALTIDELISRTVSDGSETQDLLSRLTDAQENVRVITSRTNPHPLSLRESLDSYRHDEEHMDHLLPALKERVSP